MIKIVFLMRRNPNLTFEAFSEYWLTSHANLVKSYASLLGIRRYVQSHVIAPEVAAGLRGEWNDDEPFDGLAEVHLDDVESILNIPDMEAFTAAQKVLMADEQTFVDHSRSKLFITREHVIIG